MLNKISEVLGMIQYAGIGINISQILVLLLVKHLVSVKIGILYWYQYQYGTFPRIRIGIVMTVITGIDIGIPLHFGKVINISRTLIRGGGDLFQMIFTRQKSQ